MRTTATTRINCDETLKELKEYRHITLAIRSFLKSPMVSRRFLAPP